MIKLTIQSIKQTLLWTLVAGILYPLGITAISQICFHHQANGSLIRNDHEIIGSVLLAQRFQDPRYFWPRPSAGSYATVPSGASNLGPTSAVLQTNVTTNVSSLLAAHQKPANTPVPADLVFTSGSGLDPHISPEAARFQVARVATARNFTAQELDALVDRFIEPSQWGFLGEPRVNVLLLNLELDHLQQK